jgi:peptidoglycan/LPS O-acetylase OafA/YrhL
VLLPGLLLCVFWDKLGLWLTRFPMLYCGDDLNHLGICVRDTLSARVFFGNLFFLQMIRVPTLGSDIALWSLAFEFWYYLLFPLGLLIIVGRGSVKTRVGYAALFAAMLFFVGSVVGILFPVWLLGAALVFVAPPKAGARVRGLCCALYVPVVFLLARERSFSVALADDILGCATFLLVWFLLSASEKAEPQAMNVRFWRGMSRFSFTLYVVHMPFLLFLASLSVGTTRWLPDALHLTWGLGVLMLALVFALAVAWGTEFRTDTVRRWVERWIKVWQTRFRTSREGIRADS